MLTVGDGKGRGARLLLVVLGAAALAACGRPVGSSTQGDASVPAWNTVRLEPPGTVHDLYTSADGKEVWAAGADAAGMAAVWQLDGATLAGRSAPGIASEPHPATGVWRSAAGMLWLVIEGGAVWVREGGVWRPRPQLTPVDRSTTLRLHGFGEQVWIVSELGDLWRWSGDDAGWVHEHLGQLSGATGGAAIATGVLVLGYAPAKPYAEIFVPLEGRIRGSGWRQLRYPAAAAHHDRRVLLTGYDPQGAPRLGYWRNGLGTTRILTPSSLRGAGRPMIAATVDTAQEPRSLDGYVSDGERLYHGRGTDSWRPLSAVPFAPSVMAASSSRVWIAGDAAQGVRWRPAAR